MLPDNISIEKMTRGVRIITGQTAKDRRALLNSLIELAEKAGFDEISLPAIEPAEIYSDKAGPEMLNQMYVFPDRKGRSLCLRPEGTATIQLIADRYLQGREKDVRLWYFTPCYRYERPQEGRYREFWQFGVEWLNPRDVVEARKQLLDLARQLVALRTNDFTVNDAAKRGLNYYVGDGFEIEVSSMGAQRQVCGGGIYAQGVGFGIGFDRLALISKPS